MTKDRAQHCYILGFPRSFPHSPALPAKLVQGYQWGQGHYTCTGPGPPRRLPTRCRGLA